MQDTLSFIMAHREDDVRRLALKAAGTEGVDMPFALEQIAGWQTARHKLPSWAATEGIVYPPRLSMEQCSGEPAARYKAGVAHRLAAGGRLVDITGGFGVDFSYMARGFGEAVYVERQERLCTIADGNFRRLGLSHAEVVNGDGADYLQQMEGRAALVFADPARRDTAGGRTYAISDCTPDVLGMMDMMLSKARVVMLKLSPMLDWRKAVQDIEAAAGSAGRPVVREVHIVSVGNECKELLIAVSRADGRPAVSGAEADTMERRLVCADISSKTAGESAVLSVSLDEASGLTSRPVLQSHDGYRMLYEPNASIMKAGIFDVVERRYGVRRIGPNSHLLVGGDVPVAGFPGRSFVVRTVTSMNKRELRAALAGISKANITVRNFPMTVAELRRRLKLGDGGDVYIFATTLAGGEHVLVIGNKQQG